MRITIEMWPEAFKDQPSAYGDIRRFLFRFNTKLAYLIADARRNCPKEGMMVSEGPSQEGTVFGRWEIKD